MNKLWSSLWSGTSKRLLQVFIGVLLLLWVLPELLRISLILASPRMGFGELEIKDIDLNLFSGRMVVTELRFQREGQQALVFDNLELDIGWLGWLDGEWQLEQLALSGANFSVQQTASGEWQVIMPLTASGEAGTAEPEQANTGLPKLTVQRVQITDSRIQLASSFLDGRLTLHNLDLQQLSSWREEPAHLKVSLLWNEAALRLNAQGQSLFKSPQIQGSLQLKQLQAGDFAQLLKDHLSDLQAGISSQLSFSVALSEKQDLELELDGELDVEGLSAAYRHLQLTNKQLHWQGGVKLAMQSQQLSFDVKNVIDNHDLKITDTQRQLPLMQWQSLSVAQFAANHRNTLKLDTLDLSGFRMLLHDEGELLHIPTLKLDRMTVDEGVSLHIGQVDIHDAQYRLVITPQGKILLQDQVEASIGELLDQDGASQNQSAVQEHTANESEQKHYRARIDKVRWLGDSVIDFTDLRFGEPVKQRLQISKLEVGPIDQANAHNAVELVVQGKLDEFSNLDISGKGNPFLAVPTASVKGKLEKVSLPPISPYAEAAMGYELQTGQYDHEFDVELKDNTFKLTNELSLRQLTVAGVKGDKARALDQQLDVPLGLALDMLRDSDNNIHLKVPVKGKLDDPSVDVSAIVSKAMGKALKAGSVSYLKYAIQPFGAALIVGEMLTDQASSVQFDPMHFQAGDESLPAGHAEYVTKLSGLLKDRPSLRLKLCGQSNLLDRKALQPKPVAVEGKQVEPVPQVSEQVLIDLAKQRQEGVKRALIAAGIDAERLFLCKPKFEQEGLNGVRLMM